MQKLRLVFAGTPAVAVPSLDRLAASGHDLVGVVTRRPAPLGRKRVLTPSPVAQAAAGLDVPIVEANRLDAEATSQIAALEPDLGIIVAYGGLVREPLLSTPVHGWINLHFSLLPAWRGAAPVQHSLIAGDAVAGASVFQLVPELDAGDVFAELRRPLQGDETAGELLGALADSGAGLLADVVDAIADGTARAVPQTGAPSLAPKLSIDDARLDWSRPANEVHARFRGVTPEPGAWTTIDDQRLKLLDLGAPVGDELPVLPPGELVLSARRLLIGTGTAPLELRRVQPAGKPAMDAGDWWRGSGRSAAVAR